MALKSVLLPAEEGGRASSTATLTARENSATETVKTSWGLLNASLVHLSQLGVGGRKGHRSRIPPASSLESPFGVNRQEINEPPAVKGQDSKRVHQLLPTHKTPPGEGQPHLPLLPWGAPGPNLRPRSQNSGPRFPHQLCPLPRETRHGLHFPILKMGMKHRVPPGLRWDRAPCSAGPPPKGPRPVRAPEPRLPAAHAHAPL